MAIDPKVVPISDGRPGDRPVKRTGTYDRHPIITNLQAVVSKHLQERVHTLFDSTDDALFELADKAETNTIQSMYFDSMRLVRIQRNEIETSFGENIAEAFHSFMLSGSQVEDSGLHAAISLDDMALVDDTDLEENLAITGLVGKVNNRFTQHLYAIEQRLADLMPAISVDAENNPFGPKLICDAFRSALQHLECEIKIKLIVYKLFDKHVVSQLGDMYDEVNKRFVSAGILPQLKMTIKKMPGSPGSSAEMATDSSFLEPTADTEAAHMPQDGGGDVIHGLQQLLAAARGPAVGGIPTGMSLPGGAGAGGMAGVTAGGSPGGGMVQASTTDMVNALTTLQTSGGLATAEGMGQLDATQLKAVLLEEHQRVAGNGSVGQINSVDNDVIDIVSMMFDYILEDPNLPLAAKALIGRLQIPMVKVAILDKAFFAKKSHPARALLNELAQAGIGLDDNGAIEESKRFAVLQAIVERILTDFSDDVGIFTELQADLAAHLAAEAEQAKAAEAAALQDGRQREHLKLAKTWVAEVIREHLESKRVPEVVIEIVKGPWKDVLLDTYLNDGQESRLWKEQIRFIDILVWSVEPKHSAMDRQKLAGVILQLLDTFRHGLESINYSEEELQRTLELLEPIHLASFRGKDSPDADEAPATASSQPAEPKTAEPKTLEMELDDVQGVLDEATAALDASLEEDHSVDAQPEEPAYPEVNGDQIEDIILSGFDAVDPSQEEDAPDDEYLRLARLLEAGKWVEFTDDGGKTHRAKLAWKSELLNECTFLDWKFKVVSDTTIQGLAADLRRGTARVIDDIPIFERAMDAVVSGLRTRQTSG